MVNVGQIQQILDLVVDADYDLETALLKCKVLSRRVGYKPLEEWAQRELQGYPDQESLPDYRKLSGEPKGTYTNGFNTYDNWPLEKVVVGEETFNMLKSVPILYGIKELQTKSKTDDLSLSLAHAIGFVNHIYSEMKTDGYYFNSLRVPISPGTLEGVISAIRSILVNFLLDMQEIFDDEEDVATASSEQKQEIAQAFTQNITQNISIHQPRNVAIGEGNSIEDLSQNIRISVQEGNTESLVTYLKELGLNDQDIDEIAPLFSYIYDGVPEGGDRATVSEWVLAKAEKLSGDVVSSAIATTIINGFIAYAPSAADFFSTIPLG